MAEEQTFTLQELADALDRLGWRYTSATKLMDNIIAHREPEWEEGAVVMDADQLWWKRITSPATGDRAWQGFGSPGVYGYHFPKRPLKRGMA